MWVTLTCAWVLLPEQLLGSCPVPHWAMQMWHFFLEPKGLRYIRNKALECGYFLSSWKKRWLNKVLTKIPGSTKTKHSKSKGQAQLWQLFFTVCQHWRNVFWIHWCRKRCWRLSPMGSVDKRQSSDTDWDGIAVFTFIPVLPVNLLSWHAAECEAAALPLSLF